MTEINAFQLEVYTVQNLLVGQALPAREDGAYIVMPRNDQVEGLFQLVDIQLPWMVAAPGML